MGAHIFAYVVFGIEIDEKKAQFLSGKEDYDEFYDAISCGCDINFRDTDLTLASTKLNKNYKLKCFTLFGEEPKYFVLLKSFSLQEDKERSKIIIPPTTKEVDEFKKWSSEIQLSGEYAMTLIYEML